MKSGVENLLVDSLLWHVNEANFVGGRSRKRLAHEKVQLFHFGLKAGRAGVYIRAGSLFTLIALSAIDD